MFRYALWAAGFAFAIAVGLVAALAIESAVAGRAGEKPQVSASADEAASTFQGEPGPIIRQAVKGDLDLSMVIQPGASGANDLNFYMIDTDRDWKEVKRFSVRFRYLDGRGQLDFNLVQLHEGHFPLEHLELPLAGRWAVEVVVVRAEAGESRFSWEIALSHP